jgi:hypothetical protein
MPNDFNSLRIPSCSHLATKEEPTVTLTPKLAVMNSMRKFIVFFLSHYTLYIKFVVSAKLINTKKVKDEMEINYKLKKIPFFSNLFLF